MREILVISTLDHTRQPSLFFHPGTDRPVPLVVGLHTWSYGRFNQRDSYLPLCRKYGYALLLPEFRGPNLDTNPRKAEACGSELARRDVIDAVKHVCGNHRKAEACGSELARRDVIDAVKHVCGNHAVDRKNIFLLGCSGGGQMALLAAETAPELFRAVEVWCPVSDLVLWHRHLTETHQHYVRHLEACVGGAPETRPEEYAFRSPSTLIGRLKDFPVSIHHGRHDEVVPFHHSVGLAEKLEALGGERVYLDIFDGGHEQTPAHSFEWFARLAGKANTTVGITG